MGGKHNPRTNPARIRRRFQQLKATIQATNPKKMTLGEAFGQEKQAKSKAEPAVRSSLADAFGRAEKTKTKAKKNLDQTLREALGTVEDTKTSAQTTVAEAFTRTRQPIEPHSPDTSTSPGSKSSNLHPSLAQTVMLEAGQYLENSLKNYQKLRSGEDMASQEEDSEEEISIEESSEEEISIEESSEEKVSIEESIKEDKQNQTKSSEKGLGSSATSPTRETKTQEQLTDSLLKEKSPELYERKELAKKIDIEIDKRKQILQELYDQKSKIAATRGDKEGTHSVIMNAKDPRNQARTEEMQKKNREIYEAEQSVLKMEKKRADLQFLQDYKQDSQKELTIIANDEKEKIDARISDLGQDNTQLTKQLNRARKAENINRLQAQKTANVAKIRKLEAQKQKIDSKLSKERGDSRLVKDLNEGNIDYGDLYSMEEDGQVRTMLENMQGVQNPTHVTPTTVSRTKALKEGVKSAFQSMAKQTAIEGGKSAAESMMEKMKSLLSGDPDDGKKGKLKTKNQTTEEKEPKTKKQTAKEKEPKTKNQTTEEKEPKTKKQTAKEKEPKTKNQTTEEKEPKTKKQTAKEKEPKTKNQTTEEEKSSSSTASSGFFGWLSGWGSNDGTSTSSNDDEDSESTSSNDDEDSESTSSNDDEDSEPTSSNDDEGSESTSSNDGGDGKSDETDEGGAGESNDSDENTNKTDEAGKEGETGEDADSDDDSDDGNSHAFVTNDQFSS